ncbi:MAG: XRE family transcriptional regulator, partial [Candidatus Saccharimonadales bacterium]
VEPYVLDQVAQVLHVPSEAIRNFSEDAAVQVIANTFNDSATLNAINYGYNFDPIEKIIELYEEKIALYERLLKEKNEMLEKLSKKK